MAIPATLETILNNDIVEGVRVECKTGWNPEPIMHTICAFANDIDSFYGGYILIGISDNGEVVGFPRSEFDRYQKELLSYCKKCLEPNYVPVVDLMKYQDKDVFVIWCPTGEDRPYRCRKDVYASGSEAKYVTYIRKGSLTIEANHEDERELHALSSREPFDDRVNYHYRIEDIDKSIVEDYLRKTKSNLLNDFSSRSPLDTYLDLRIIGGPKEDYRPKNVSLLMFTPRPADYIPYSYIELTIFEDLSGESMIEKTFDGPLFKQYGDCMDFIKNQVIKKKTIKTEGEYLSKTVSNYAYGVLEEVIANAILHKSYQIGEPVTIRVEPNRIEVTSVPGFDRTISNVAVKELKPRSKRYQSRRIAEFLKELGIIEAKNTGYPLIIKKSKENSSPLPIIEMNEERDYVTVIIPINEVFNDVSLPLKERIIDLLNEKSMSKTEICRHLGYKRVVNSVTYQLQKMKEEGLVAENNKKYRLI